MLIAGGFKSQKALATELKVSQSYIAKWKKQGFIPDDILETFSAFNLQNTSRDSIGSKHVNENPDTYAIPALEIKASAGEGNHVEGIDSFESWTTINIDKMLFKDKPSKNLRAIQVDGYSMTPMLMPDSWIIFELDRDFEGDGLYIINWRNILMVKQIQLDMKSGNLNIISFNKDYKSYDVDPDDQSVLRIIGKVVRVII
jgi:phage repressor protein C with HTH and peptisase S24 domain